MVSLILRLGHITTGVPHTTSSFDWPLGVVSSMPVVVAFLDTQGDLFLDEVFSSSGLPIFFLKPFWWKLGFVSLFFWLIVGLYIAVLLHPVPRVVHLGFSLHLSFYTSILALQYESVGG